jgi:transcriptional regulator with XRE-family HTH domain
MKYSEKSNILWRKLRLSLDLSQKEFGQKLGVGAGYISEIESGKKEPSHTLSELFRYVYEEAYEDNLNVEKQTTENIKTAEVDKNLQNELILAYRKIVERDEVIFRLTQQLDELNETPVLRKRKPT